MEKNLMDLDERLLGNYRDKQLLKLYVMLSHSDFKGNYEDTFTIELLYSLMCIDLADNLESPSKLNPSEMCLLARNVVRLIDDGDLNDYSIFNWSRALLTYMKENNKSVKDVHKTSTLTLYEDVEKYLQGK